MNRTWLVIDSHNLCHRAWHSLPKLSWKGRPTEVIFGFLNSVDVLRRHFVTDDIVFCFEDSRSSFRKKLFADYKSKRHTPNPDPVEVQSREMLYQQIVGLRERHLPKAGFKNVLQYRGMESDDIMAVISRSLAYTKDDVILVTSDSDLYQCLAPNVMIYSLHDKKLKTEKWFKETHGIPPSRWAFVKAVGGCHTDCVPGIPGVGETTALKYARKELPKTTKAYQSIVAGKQIILRNRALVELPGGNCPIPELVPHRWPDQGWRKMLQSLGARTRMRA